MRYNCRKGDAMMMKHFGEEGKKSGIWLQTPYRGTSALCDHVEISSPDHERTASRATAKRRMYILDKVGSLIHQTFLDNCIRGT